MAANLIQVDCTNASTKVSTAEGHCIYWSNRCKITACNNTLIYYILLKAFSDLEWSIQAVGTPQ